MSKPTILAFFIVLGNLEEFFGCSIKADIISTIFGFSAVFFDCWATIFDCFMVLLLFFPSNKIDSILWFY